MITPTLCPLFLFPIQHIHPQKKLLQHLLLKFLFVGATHRLTAEVIVPPDQSPPPLENKNKTGDLLHTIQHNLPSLKTSWTRAGLIILWWQQARLRWWQQQKQQWWQTITQNRDINKMMQQSTWKRHQHWQQQITTLKTTTMTKQQEMTPATLNDNNHDNNDSDKHQDGRRLHHCCSRPQWSLPS